MPQSHLLTRELLPSERPLLRDHLLRLSVDDRISRFSGARSDESVQRYVDHIDFSKDHIKVAFDAELNVIAAMHLALIGDGSAEFALSIEAAHRKHGHGRDLFKVSIRWMQNRGVRKAYSTCMRSNEAMMHIAASAGMHLHYEGSSVDAFLDLDSGSFVDFWQEIVEEQTAWVDFTGKLLSSTHGIDYLAAKAKA